MIYIGMISQKKPSYGGSKNWILKQDSGNKNNRISSWIQKNIWLEIHPFL